jgi:hypothetical protein
VTSFDRDAELTHPLDFLLMQNGPVVLVQDDTGSLQKGLAQLGYDIVELDAGRWSDAAAMHQDLALRLTFPGYYGRNFAALRRRPARGSRKQRPLRPALRAPAAVAAGRAGRPPIAPNRWSTRCGLIPDGRKPGSDPHRAALCRVLLGVGFGV